MDCFNIIKNNRLRVCHIVSLARSGETILMRNLSVHSKVKIVHNFRESDTLYEQTLFKHIKNNTKGYVSRLNPITWPYKPSRNDVFVIKQGVWNHKYDFEGVCLLRHPLSIFASLRKYDRENFYVPPEKKSWHLTQNRLMRWLKEMNPSALLNFESLPPLQQFAVFYNERMRYIFDLCLPIIKYETLVRQPEFELSRILKFFSLDFEEGVIHAEQYFPDGYKGHGLSDFSKPLHPNSVDSYLNELSEVEIEELRYLIFETGREAGYF